MEETKNVEQRSSMKLIKGQKDSYGWEIKCYNEDLDIARQQIVKQDQELRKLFNGGGK